MTLEFLSSVLASALAPATPMLLLQSLKVKDEIKCKRMDDSMKGDVGAGKDAWRGDMWGGKRS